MEKVMVLFSGGLDSTTCLAMAVDRYGKENVLALSVYYGQRHDRELQAAKEVLDYYGVKGMEINLENIFADSNCSLLTHSKEEIPEKSYEEQLRESGEKPVSTYVPFRNGLFLSAAASIAIAQECTSVWYGAHRDDAAGSAYPDCSKVFFDSMAAAIFEGSGQSIRLEAPFIEKTKADVVAQGLELKVPYELTWSCYEGNQKACGRCGTCIDRIEAFKENGVKDPMGYEGEES